MKSLLTVVILLTLVASASGSQMRAFQMREDYGAEPLYNCYMNYYYYIPSPTYSWFWAYSGLSPRDVIGVFFTVGDPTMSAPGCNPGYTACDPYNAHTIEQFRVLDFAGYGTLYTGLFTVEFDIYCSDAQGCPVGPALWRSRALELCAAGWNYIAVSPNVAVTGCCTQYPSVAPRFLLTATSVGTNGGYPAWGFDNISTPLLQGSSMHDHGCCPALYPRPATSHYSTMHTGYYGVNFQYCPPEWFLDGRDTTAGHIYGYVELAWRIYLINSGPDAVVPSSWGNIKSMYR